MSMLDNETVTIPCPACEREIPLKIGNLRKSPNVICSCGQHITVEGRQFNNEMSKLDAAERRLDASISRLNKTLGG
jgi:hypothetical protein